MKPTDRSGKDPNQGEGDRVAARRYNQDVRRFVERDHATGAARDAADALDGPEGAKLRAAEAQAARVGRPTLRDRVKGLINRARREIAKRR